MAYEVLARKWRPRQFADVIGQEHVTRTLINAIESKRIAHAYLFVGPRGIGKTTLSRIFAKALNCSAHDEATPHPCDACNNCREIMAGSSLDVVEIDAASNNGVDNIRQLRDAVQFTPANARYKIFIVDEVHMLSKGAFNALLKTLEEPPPHVKFIFATTEFDKIPETIVSRCQRFTLRRIPTALIAKTLAGICTSEGVTASEDALLAIARGADGGMRDALSALDQIISFKGDGVTEADVTAVFGLVSRERIEALTTAVLTGDMAEALRIVDALDRAGKNLQRLVVELLDHFRNVIVRQQLGADAAPLLDVTDDQLKTLDAQAGLADTARVLRVVEHFVDLEGRIRYTLSQRTLFEATLIRCCRASTAPTLDQVISLIAKTPAAGGGAVAESATASTRAVAGGQAQPIPPAMPAKAMTLPAPAGGQARPAYPPAPPARPPREPGLRDALLGAKRAAPPAPPPAPAPAPVKKAVAPATPPAPASAVPAQPQPAATAPQQAEGGNTGEGDGDGDDNDSPIRAAHEPAIKKALQLFGGTIVEIKPPQVRQVPETVPADGDDFPSDLPEQDFDPSDPGN